MWCKILEPGFDKVERMLEGWTTSSQ